MQHGRAEEIRAEAADRDLRKAAIAERNERILELFASGNSKHEIAAALNCSYWIVQNVIQRNDRNVFKRGMLKRLQYRRKSIVRWVGSPRP